MKRIAAFLIALVFLSITACGQAVKETPLLVMPQGTKIKIEKDKRPGGNATGQEATYVEIRKNTWFLTDIAGINDERISKDLPNGFVSLNSVKNQAERSKDLPTKIAILFGDPVFRLNSGESILGSESIFMVLDKKVEEDLKTRIENRIAELANYRRIAGQNESVPDPYDLAKPSFPKDTKAIGKFDYDWPLKTLANTDLNMASVKGKTLFINIWATWCGPCLMEMPSLQKLYDQAKDDAVFFFVSDEEAKTVQKLLEDKNYTLPVFLTDWSQVPSVFKTDGIPATFIVAPDGNVVYKHVGSANWNTPETIGFLRRLKNN